MGLFDSSTKQQQTSQQNYGSTSQSQLPSWVTDQAQSNLQFGNNAVANWQTPQQQTPFGFTDLQNQAGGYFANQAQMGGNSYANNMALQAAGSAANWQPPQVYAPGYSAQNVGMPQGYQAAQSAGPMQVQNQQVQAQNVSMDPIQAALAQASLLGNAATYNAQNAQQANLNRGDIQNISGPTTAGLSSMTQDLMNPYTQNVYDTSLTDLDRARQMTQTQNAAQAAQAGAFGSSRQGVMDSLTNADFARQASNLAANLNSQGFTQAQNTAQALQQQGQQAQMANQNIDLQTALTNAGYGQQVALANQGAQNTAAQYNTGSQNQFSQLNQAAQNQINLANQQAQNQISLANQANNQWAQGSNQSANLQASLANAQNALQAGLANQSAGLQNNQFNASSLNNAGQFNAGQNFQAGLANQAAQNQGGQFNAGQNMQAFLANQAASQAAAGMGLQAANTFAGIGSNQFNQGAQGAQNLLNFGNQQQQYGQNVQDVNYQNQQANAQAPFNMATFLAQMLQSTPYPTATNQTGWQTGSGTGNATANPSIMSDIGGFMKLLSDVRVKEDIMPIGSDMPNMPLAPHPHLRDPLKAIRRIKPATFHWKGSAPGTRDLGLLAQNVERAVPEAVSTHPVTGLKQIHVPAMMGLLTGAVNQLADKVDRRRTKTFSAV